MRIIGIVLVRNEERFVAQAIRNISGFCDRILVADHESRDRTPEILSRLCGELANVEVTRISHPSESHDMLKPYAGTPTWVFGVDGDELYEPDRLQNFRRIVASGRFDRSWMVFGNVLHCDELDDDHSVAQGYLTPPCRSMTKFYNFNAITSWDGPCMERLHGGEPTFKPGFSGADRVNLFLDHDWDSSPFRCLHLCFLPRSGEDKRSTRRNIMETYGATRLHGWIERTKRALWPFGRSDWKTKRYYRGDRVAVKCASFFPSTRA